MIDATARAKFWHVVEDCLIKLFSQSPEKARQLWVELSRQIESPPDGLPSEMFYHAEPYDVACDLAGQVPEWDRDRQAYELIVQTHKW